MSTSDQASLDNSDSSAQKGGCTEDTAPAEAPHIIPALAERYDIRILKSLRRIMRAVDLHSRHLSIVYKITGPQLVCLMAIVDEGSATPSAIGRKVHLSPSTMVGILDRLEAKGLIRRERDSRDRRRVNVTATDKCREIVASAPSPLQDTLAKALRNLPDLEQTAIALSLERIVELMEARHIDAEPML